MIVNDFLKKVSLRLGDEARVTYSNKELISALNDAITQLSLISAVNQWLTSHRKGAIRHDGQ